ncbi:hypothetical protein AC792_00085 [Arthrobacter sp. RIT-PI-e]|uniref:hypothetical protein n=1 Tax=Arthrobacter sp. RIT-PI-e TaxID=1681197 RepID=UPI000676ABA7|nr:hypothetical protein [Arthrobacter sp. RIT-PI-e]KNC20516.1 hypothetical protein AC792_00085 [Arthrobacter sp. RIT-PI-e]
MKKNESYRHDASLQSIGMMVLLLLVLPAAIHGGEGHWTGTDQLVLTLGVLLVLAWSVRTVVRVTHVVRSRRRRSRVVRVGP